MLRHEKAVGKPTQSRTDVDTEAVLKFDKKNTVPSPIDFIQLAIKTFCLRSAQLNHFTKALNAMVELNCTMGIVVLVSLAQ